MTTYSVAFACTVVMVSAVSAESTAASLAGGESVVTPDGNAVVTTFPIQEVPAGTALTYQLQQEAFTSMKTPPGLANAYPAYTFTADAPGASRAVPTFLSPGISGSLPAPITAGAQFEATYTGPGTNNFLQFWSASGDGTNLDNLQNDNKTPSSTPFYIFPSQTTEPAPGPPASYEPHLADATYQAAGIAAEGLEEAMEATSGRFCVEGRWHAGALPAYQAMLEASIACRAIRSRRIGLQDQMRRISNDQYEYVEEWSQVRQPIELVSLKSFAYIYM